MEHELRQSIMSLGAAFRDATDKSLLTIGKLALNDNTFFPRIERGDGFNVKTFDRLVQWFADNWPEGAEWPPAIERPEVSSPAQMPSRERA